MNYLGLTLKTKQNTTTKLGGNLFPVLVEYLPLKSSFSPLPAPALGVVFPRRSLRAALFKRARLCGGASASLVPH